MSPRTPGSAAAARRATPKSAVKRAVVRSAMRLLHVAELARIAGEHDRPTRGAQYLLDVLAEVEPDLELLRRHVRTTPSDSP